MIFNDSKDNVEGKAKDNTNFLIAKNGGVLKFMDKDEDDNISLKLTKKIKVSDDTFIFRFSFDQNHTLGLPIGKHVIFSVNMKTKAEPNGELVCRKYTPISMKNYLRLTIELILLVPIDLAFGMISSFFSIWPRVSKVNTFST